MVEATRTRKLADNLLAALSRGLVLAAAVGALASCGGNAPGSDPTGAGAVASVEVSTSKSAMAARADESVTITVTAVDGSRRGVSGAKVQLAADSGVISSGTTTTDSSGKLTATFTLGQDRSNRTVNITASTSGSSGSATIQVTGTTVTLSSNTSVVSNASATAKLTARLLDAASQPISGAVVQLSTTQGSLSSTTATTDAGGVATADITGISSAATITARAGNTSSSVSILASGTTTVSPEPAGIVIQDFIIQANPAVTGPNQGGNTGNFSVLEVRVFGTLGATPNLPVKNAPVRFRIASTPALGSLEVDTSTNPALTNEVGLAGNRFIPGAATSGTDFIVICASVSGLAAPATPGVNFPGNPCTAGEKAVRLTIAQQALFVKISVDNTLAATDGGLTRTNRFIVGVTDAAGRGVPGVQITPRLLPLFYYKGFYVFDPTEGVASWVPATYVQCANEDTNFNGTLDATDNNLNGDAFVWPGQIAALSMDNGGITDSTGFVIGRAKFGARYGSWADYQLEARASVSGTEGLATELFSLGVLVSEAKNKDVAPTWVTSPFGTGGSCASPN